jgi:F-type H+-transporting ATPase subunit gamma
VPRAVEHQTLHFALSHVAYFSLFIALVQMQIKSTTGIRKITASMKMVSAAKLKGDEGRLKVATAFNTWTHTLCPERKEIDEYVTFEELPQKVLIVPFTSDKGLCGGINSFIFRGVKKCVSHLKEQGKESDIVIIGEKGRNQMRRVFENKIQRTATDIVSPGTYSLATALTSEIFAAGGKDYDAIVLIYNHFVNPAVYKQMYQVIPPVVGVGEDNETLLEYEVDGDKNEVFDNLYEFMVASQVYHSFMDGAASEQSSRMAAMENASQNAGEMIEKLTLKYNRARQSRITTELIEIISGAAALDD